jgi:hypothetical protein
MDLTALIARLQALVTSSPQVLGQATAAAPGTFELPLDSGAEIVTRLSSVASVFVDTMLEQGTSPSIVYESETFIGQQENGFRFTQIDQITLTLRCATDALRQTKMIALVAALDASSFNIQIDRVTYGFDYEQRQYGAEIELQCSYLIGTQTYPAAFVYQIVETAGETVADNFVQQRQDNNYGIMVVTQDGDMPALVDAIKTTLIGWQQAAGYEQFEYVSGTGLEGVAGLEIWRLEFRDALYLSQA